MITKGQSDGRLFVSFSFKKVEIYFIKRRFFRKNALSGLKNDISGRLSQNILSACYTDIIKLKEIMKMSIAKKSEDNYFSWSNLLLVLLLVFILGQSWLSSLIGQFLSIPRKELFRRTGNTKNFLLIRIVLLNSACSKTDSYFSINCNYIDYHSILERIHYDNYLYHSPSSL